MTDYRRCYGCFNKLNKLEKIDFDLENKLQRLTAEKSCLLKDLRCLTRVKNVNSFTPTRIHSSLRTKRAIIHTPTPRKYQITTENDRDGNFLQEETWSVFTP